MKTLVAVSSLIASLAAGCGAATVCPDPVAVDVWALRTTPLTGTWVVIDADGSTVGTMLFGETSVEATWDDVRLVGRYSSAFSTTGQRIEMAFDQSHQAGIDEVWEQAETVVVNLVAVAPDQVVALQDNGAYTVWTRLAPEAP